MSLDTIAVHKRVSWAFALCHDRAHVAVAQSARKIGTYWTQDVFVLGSKV
jgi:hypothetical protein